MSHACESGNNSPREYSENSINIRQQAKRLFDSSFCWPEDQSRIKVVYKSGSIEAQVLANEISKALKVEILDVENIQENEKEKLELIITIGGDGTVLQTAWVFQTLCPPILPLHCGTLGFLTIAPAFEFDKVMEAISGKTPKLNIRMRLQVDIYDRFDKIMASRNVLNEVEIDRGPSQHMAILEIFGGENFLTKMAGDGLVISTPTGSTAYSLAAGGSIVHPSLPGILVTPICPHSLSFRPILFPDWMSIKVKMSEDNRSQTNWISLDGRDRFELSRGQYLIISLSPYPVATICLNGTTSDWINNLSKCLSYNIRDVQ